MITYLQETNAYLRSQNVLKVLNLKIYKILSASKFNWYFKKNHIISDFKDPLESVMQNIGKIPKKQNLEVLMDKINETIKNNKKNRQLEIDSRELKSMFVFWIR